MYPRGYLSGDLAEKQQVRKLPVEMSCSYYPMIGVFKSEQTMDKAFERTKRPGEETEIESQRFHTPERAMGAIQGKYPDFVM